jgi:hypothetical protein
MEIIYLKDYIFVLIARKVEKNTDTQDIALTFCIFFPKKIEDISAK